MMDEKPVVFVEVVSSNTSDFGTFLDDLNTTSPFISKS